MLWSIPLVSLFIFTRQVIASPVKRAQCAATLTIAVSVATTLQSHYYDSTSGMYNGGSLWTDGNTLEDLHNLMLATGTDPFSTVADSSYIGKSALDSGTNWQSVLNGANDDAGWLVLALIKIGDYMIARGLDGTPFNNAAVTIYNIIAGEWDDTVCNGGVWWSSAHTYKNAITNELFLLTSSELYIRMGGETYLDNANKVWAWLFNSGMRNAQGLWNDGLTDTCVNNGQTTWTYNQGVIASGLSSLAYITGNTTLLDQAEITLDATIADLTVNDILKESCDSATGATECDADQQIFKGIWTKHVQYYLDRANDATRTAKYSPFLGSQESAVYHYGTDSSNDVGSVWYAPNAGGSLFTPKTSASGLEAHISAAKYGPC